MPIDFRKPQYFKEFRFGNNLIWNTIKKSLNTFTGEIVRFFSEESEPIIKLEANFTPIQDLNGYDAPWPPGGGKNKIGLKKSEAVIFGWNVTFPFTIEPGTYIISCQRQFGGTTNKGASVSLLDANNNNLLYFSGYQFGDSSFVGTSQTVTEAIAAATTAIRFGCQEGIDSTEADSIINAGIQLELGSTATAYEPYSNICPISGHTGCDIFDKADYDPQATPTVTISFGQTVYSGTLTVNEDGSGQVVADSELEVFNTVEDNTLKSQLNFFNTAVTGVGTIGDYTRIAFAVRPDVDQSKYNRYSNTYAYTMCNMAKHRFSYNNESTHWYRNTVLYVFLPTSLVGSTVQSVFDYLTSIKDTTPLSLWIPLATPITIPVTAQQIQTLVGTNTIWVNDATGDITVQAYGTAIT